MIYCIITVLKGYSCENQNMILYKKDFKYFFYSRLLNKSSLQRFDSVKNKNKKNKCQNCNDLKRTFWKTFCQRSSIHGIGYIVDDDLHKFEK